jgi:hypothetical protein
MKINQNDFLMEQTNYLSEYYTLLGLEDHLDDDGYPKIDQDNNKGYAKKVKNKKSKSVSDRNVSFRFYIKMDPNNNIINPVLLHSEKNHNLRTNSRLNQTCKETEQYKEVSESIFNKYLEFLKTKNSKWLNAAQRELL